MTKHFLIFHQHKIKIARIAIKKIKSTLQQHCFNNQHFNNAGSTLTQHLHNIDKTWIPLSSTQQQLSKYWINCLAILSQHLSNFQTTWLQQFDIITIQQYLLDIWTSYRYSISTQHLYCWQNIDSFNITTNSSL